jgi:hypothetical protein
MFSRKNLYTKSITTIFFVSLLTIFFLKRKQSEHNVVDCTIFDMKGSVLWTLNGGACVFFDDGRVAISQGTNYKMLDKNLKELWSLPYQAHHQVNSSENEILLLAYDYFKINDTLYRSDSLVVVNHDGRELKRFRVIDHLEEVLCSNAEKINNSEFLTQPTEGEDSSGVRSEVTHINSFYKIPPNKTEKVLPEFKRGNYIFNEILNKKIHILSSDLKSILWTLDTKSAVGDGGSAHDVQVLDNGKLLLYSNRSENPNKFSSIDLYDPISKKLTHLFIDSPPQKFFSKSKGGAQLLANGHLLYSDTTGRPKVFEVDPTNPNYKVWELDISSLNADVKILNRVRRLNLTSFLEENKPL